jgi:hypothetical protein
MVTLTGYENVVHVFTNHTKPPSRCPNKISKQAFYSVYFLHDNMDFFKPILSNLALTTS